MYLHDSVLRLVMVGTLPRHEGLCFNERGNGERRVGERADLLTHLVTRLPPPGA